MYLKWHFGLILLVQILRNINVTAIGEVDQKPKWKDVLSRQKRYLIFIEGSSLQLGKICGQLQQQKIEITNLIHILVYDQIVPIVDYTNLFIFGLTVSMAWELPDKPHYPPNDADANKRKYAKAKHKTSAVNATRTTSDQYMLDNSDEVVYNHSIYHNYVDNDSLRNYLITKVTNKLSAGAYAMPWQNVKTTNFEWKSEESDWNDRYHQRFPIHYEPYIRYPALRMRREIVERKFEEDIFNQHHINHHISTRMDLYEKIRKYLDA